MNPPRRRNPIAREKKPNKTKNLSTFFKNAHRDFLLNYLERKGMKELLSDP
jgi:hypothetical protein